MKCIKELISKLDDDYQKQVSNGDICFLTIKELIDILNSSMSDIEKEVEDIKQEYYNIGKHHAMNMISTDSGHSLEHV